MWSKMAKVTLSREVQAKSSQSPSLLLIITQSSDPSFFGWPLSQFMKFHGLPFDHFHCPPRYPLPGRSGRRLLSSGSSPGPSMTPGPKLGKYSS